MPLKETACRRIFTEAGVFFYASRNNKSRSYKSHTPVSDFFGTGGENGRRFLCRPVREPSSPALLAGSERSGFCTEASPAAGNAMSPSAAGFPYPRMIQLIRYSFINNINSLFYVQKH
jgi:hypothetical protein